MFNKNKMNVEEVIKSIEWISLFIDIILFLLIKFLKYLISRERLKIKKSLSVFNSIDSPSPKRLN